MANDMAGSQPDDLLRRLRLEFHDSSLLAVALTHRSTVNERPEASLEDNERLEFLGDAVLGAVVAEELYRAFPSVPEGSLTLMRAELVCQAGLARWARHFDLGFHLVLGRGEEQRGGRERDGLLASAFEALIGAVYLDQGYAAVQRLVAELVAEAMPELSPSARAQDPKSVLQHRVQARSHSLPSYQVRSVSGPEHQPLFTVEVSAEGGVFGVGAGASKQAAEQEAARQALDAWHEVD
jgi:ribonuclease III